MAGTDRVMSEQRSRPEAQSAAAPSPFPAIADYAFLSNCHTGALVAPDGSVDWLCVPRFDSPSVFAALLDRQAGSFRLAPFGVTVPNSRTYEPGTNTLVTTWNTRGGWVVVRDALTMGPRTGEDRVTPYTRPPADDRCRPYARPHRAMHRGPGRDRAGYCEPVFDYGRTSATWTLLERRRSGRPMPSPATRRLRLQSSIRLGIEGDSVRGRHTLSAGEEMYCSLSWAEGLASPATTDDANARMAATTRFWRTWIGHARIPDHRWRYLIMRSALVIKGLTYLPTGATVAALTTSLPETPGGERNWDYRYSWMRDSTFTLQALHWLNLDWEANEFMEFVADLKPNDDGALQIMYGIDGRRDLTEFNARRPVRLRRRAPGAHRQWCVRPAPERRLRRRAGIHPAAYAAKPAAAPPSVADRPVAGRVRRAGVA